MGATKYLIIGGGALAVAGFAYYKYAKNNFQIEYGGISINNISEDYRTINVALTFNLSSKARIQFDVKGIQFNIYANGVLVGTGQQSLPIVIPGNGIEIPLVMQATLSLGNLESTVFSTLISKITGGGGMVVVIEGQVQAGVDLPVLSYFTLNYPFNQTESLPF